MNRQAVASELVKIAESLTAGRYDVRFVFWFHGGKAIPYWPDDLGRMVGQVTVNDISGVQLVVGTTVIVDFDKTQRDKFLYEIGLV